MCGIHTNFADCFQELLQKNKQLQTMKILEKTGEQTLELLQIILNNTPKLTSLVWIRRYNVSINMVNFIVNQQGMKNIIITYSAVMI